ncbi:MAG TPA: type II CAAX endopeptidase family protein [Xanthobacteraceae bacterium]|jgi:hypothetical protein
MLLQATVGKPVRPPIAPRCYGAPAQLTHSTEATDVRQRWKQVALTFITALLVMIAYVGCAIALMATRNRSELAAYGAIAITSLLAYLAGVRLIEWRPVTEFSLSRFLPEIAAGLVAGIALFAAMIGVLWIAGVYQPQGWTSIDGSIGTAFVLWVAVGVHEEILFRGLVYRLCCKIFGTWGAIVMSGLLFGLVHGTEPGATAIALSSVALAGLLFGAAFALTGRLWLPIGIHTGWNFAEGSLFGTAVSGNTYGNSLTTAKLIGPDILTGGRFGPEASVVTVIVLSVVTTFLLWRIARLRRSVLPIWRIGRGEPAAIVA